MANSLINMKRALYRLKRRYATPVTLCKRENLAVDTKTGQKTYNVTSILVRHAMVLQSRDYRMFVYDLAFISANKDFTAGGYFDPSDRKVIIDKADLPSDYILTNDQFLRIGNRQYQIYEFSDNPAALVISAKMLRGERDMLVDSTVNVLVLNDLAEAYIDHGTYSVASALDFREDIDTDEFSVFDKLVEQEVVTQDIVQDVLE